MSTQFAGKKWLIPWVVAIAMFIDTLDSTIVSVAIPSIAASFNINPVDMKLALTGYLLSLAVFIPISGWLADRYGERRLFILAVIVFTLSSILCAMATDLTLLIVMRVVQGFGGALMMPVGRLIMLRNFSKVEYAQAMGLVVIPGLIGPALGPTIGGLILQFATWHWIFLVNVPFGILEVIVAFAIIAPTPPRPVAPFNWAGFTLFSLGLVMMTFSLALLGDNFQLWPWALLIALAGIGLLLAYWQVALRQKQPLLDIALFKQKTFGISIMAMLLVRPSTAAIVFMVPLLLQVVWGKTALFSGVCFMFLALGMLLARVLLQQWLVSAYGFKQTLLYAVLALTVLSMNLCWFSAPQPFVVLAIMLFLIGIATSQVYTCLGLMSVIEVEAEKYSQATSISSAAQQFAAGCGVAIAAIILHAVSSVLHLPLFSSEVFFWTLIVLNSVSLLALFFIVQLNPILTLPQS